MGVFVASTHPTRRPSSQSHQPAKPAQHRKRRENLQQNDGDRGHDQINHQAIERSASPAAGRAACYRAARRKSPPTSPAEYGAAGCSQAAPTRDRRRCRARAQSGCVSHRKLMPPGQVDEASHHGTQHEGDEQTAKIDVGDDQADLRARDRSIFRPETAWRRIARSRRPAPSGRRKPDAAACSRRSSGPATGRSPARRPAGPAAIARWRGSGRR